MELKERLKKVPLEPGVYLFKDQDDRVIYVGKARILRNRMRSYFQSPKHMDSKVRAMVNRIADFDFIITNSEVEALILENNLIKAYRPRYNIFLRDDKTYPYLKVTIKDKYPRVCIVREEKDGISRYFGPYTNVTSLKEMLKLIRNIFPLRICRTLKRQARPCLNYDINKCLGPCTGKITPEEYNEVVQSLLNFLSGNYVNLLQELEADMKEAVNNLEFEKAAVLRDKIAAIRTINEKQGINFDLPYNLDMVSFITGEKENLVLVFRVRQGKITAKDTYWLSRVINESDKELVEVFIKRYYHDNSDIPPEILVNMIPGELELLQSWLWNTAGKKVVLRIPQRGAKKKMLDMVVKNAELFWEEKEHNTKKQEDSLIKLSKQLKLEIVPERIECFDISHLSGQDTVASMVVFTGGIPDKKAY